MLTAVSTVLGLIPIAPTVFWGPMAFAIMGGLLALHISSRHFALLPIVARIGHDLGLAIVNIENPSIPVQRSRGSRWVFLSRDEASIDALARAAQSLFEQLGLERDLYVITRPGAEAVASAPLWTDDYSDLLGALKSRRERELE